MGSNTSRLLQLLDAAGAVALEDALVEVLEHNTVHIGAVRQVLDKRRSELGLPPPVTIALSSDEHRDLVITPHALSTYDALKKDGNHDTDLTPTELKTRLKALGLFGLISCCDDHRKALAPRSTRHRRARATKARPRATHARRACGRDQTHGRLRLEIEAESYRLKEAKELNAARSKRRSKKEPAQA